MNIIVDSINKIVEAVFKSPYSVVSKGRRGEIAATLTVLTLVVMVIGGLFGIKNTKTTGSSAAGNCLHSCSRASQCGGDMECVVRGTIEGQDPKAKETVCYSESSCSGASRPSDKKKFGESCKKAGECGKDAETGRGLTCVSGTCQFISDEIPSEERVAKAACKTQTGDEAYWQRGTACNDLCTPDSSCSNSTFSCLCLDSAGIKKCWNKQTRQCEVLQLVNLTGKVTVNSNGRYYDNVAMHLCEDTGNNSQFCKPAINLYTRGRRNEAKTDYTYNFTELAPGVRYYLSAKVRYEDNGTNKEQATKASADCPQNQDASNQSACEVRPPLAQPQNFTINLPLQTVEGIPVYSPTPSPRSGEIRVPTRTPEPTSEFIRVSPTAEYCPIHVFAQITDRGGNALPLNNPSGWNYANTKGNVGKFAEEPSRPGFYKYSKDDIVELDFGNKGLGAYKKGDSILWELSRGNDIGQYKIAGNNVRVCPFDNNRTTDCAGGATPNDYSGSGPETKSVTLGCDQKIIVGWYFDPVPSPTPTPQPLGDLRISTILFFPQGQSQLQPPSCGLSEVISKVQTDRDYTFANFSHDLWIADKDGRRYDGIHPPGTGSNAVWLFSKIPAGDYTIEYNSRMKKEFLEVARPCTDNVTVIENPSYRSSRGSGFLDNSDVTQLAYVLKADQDYETWTTTTCSACQREGGECGPDGAFAELCFRDNDNKGTGNGCEDAGGSCKTNLVNGQHPGCDPVTESEVGNCGRDGGGYIKCCKPIGAGAGGTGGKCSRKTCWYNEGSVCKRGTCLDGSENCSKNINCGYVEEKPGQGCVAPVTVDCSTGVPIGSGVQTCASLARSPGIIDARCESRGIPSSLCAAGYSPTADRFDCPVACCIKASSSSGNCIEANYCNNSSKPGLTNCYSTVRGANRFCCPNPGETGYDDTAQRCTGGTGASSGTCTYNASPFCPISGCGTGKVCRAAPGKVGTWCCPTGVLPPSIPPAPANNCDYQGLFCNTFLDCPRDKQCTFDGGGSSWCCPKPPAATECKYEGLVCVPGKSCLNTLGTVCKIAGDGINRYCCPPNVSPPALPPAPEANCTYVRPLSCNSSVDCPSEKECRYGEGRNYWCCPKPPAPTECEFEGLACWPTSCLDTPQTSCSMKGAATWCCPNGVNPPKEPPAPAPECRYLGRIACVRSDCDSHEQCTAGIAGLQWCCPIGTRPFADLKAKIEITNESAKTITKVKYVVCNDRNQCEEKTQTVSVKPGDNVKLDQSIYGINNKAMVENENHKALCVLEYNDGTTQFCPEKIVKPGDDLIFKIKTGKTDSRETTGVVKTTLELSDCDNDKKITTLDYTSVVNQYGQTGASLTCGDTDLNGTINAADVSEIIGNFDKTVE